jgi:hypothetical protein
MKITVAVSRYAGCGRSLFSRGVVDQNRSHPIALADERPGPSHHHVAFVDPFPGLDGSPRLQAKGDAVGSMPRRAPPGRCAVGAQSTAENGMPTPQRCMTSMMA